jgi:transcriptional regulator with XRE-family HTH domain
MLCGQIKEILLSLYGITYMTATEQIANQLKAARLAKGLSLRGVAALAKIPASTLEGYESGSAVPAEKLARIAEVLEHPTFKIDDYRFTVSRAASEAPTPPDQLSLDFTGEYSYAKATVKISPRKITIFLDGRKVTSSSGVATTREQ